jgi:hypothetical protein
LQKPRAPVRRFDVFAEFNRLKAIEDGMQPDEAEGHGLWVAKVVASRSFGGSAAKPPKPGEAGSRAGHEEEGPQEKPKWHTLDGKPQTDELFQREIVNRMGKEFYDAVFRPAIEEAYREGRSYQSIRDTIRREWKP